IAQVYMHIARYNFYYLESSLGIAPPPGIDVEHLEEITEKERVRALLQRSIDHVRTSIRNMSESDLTNRTMLYGREVESWSVLFQLLAHMNEHVGQSVSYARMNGIVPPWSS
ncbi:MAG: DinB family protein, partial [Bacteroidetes bacterium]|nr:DinB family protein [Bacteroidota bacterium]